MRRGILPPADAVREHCRAEASPASADRGWKCRDQRARFARGFRGSHREDGGMTINVAACVIGDAVIAPASRLCAALRACARNLPAETTAAADGHTCRTRQAPPRWPSAALPALRR